MPTSIADIMQQFNTNLKPKPYSTIYKDPQLGSNLAVDRLSKNISHSLLYSGHPGFRNALDLLSQRGATDPRAEVIEREGVEADRQISQQDISQQAAMAGHAGSIGTAALGQLADQAASGRQADISERLAAEQQQRRSSDIGEILLGMLQQTGLDLTSGRVPSPNQTRPSIWNQVIGAAGSGLGAYTTLLSALNAFGAADSGGGS